MTNEPVKLERRTVEPHYGEAARAVSLVDAANLLLRQWRIIIIVPAVLFLATAVYNILKPRSYTSTAALVAQGPGVPGGRFSGLAAQLGVSFPTTETSESPEFYADLITSREILEGVAAAPYTQVMKGVTRQRPLAEIFEVEMPDPERRMAATVRALRKQISVATGRNTGIIRISVVAREPGIAKQIADNVIDLVTRFDLERRRTRAGAERQFVEARLAEERKALREAEDALQNFLSNNRQFDSPVLAFTRDRLQRRVGDRQQLVTSISQAYEQARIEEVRNIPAITVIERPAVPVFPNPRGLVSKTLVAGVLGLMLGILIALAREAFRRSVELGEPGANEFVVLRGRMLAAVPLLRRIGARTGESATEEVER